MIPENASEYLVKPWFFGPRNGIEDRLLFSAYVTSMVSLPLVTTMVYADSKDTKVALGYAGINLAITLVGYVYNKMQKEGLIK